MSNIYHPPNADSLSPTPDTSVAADKILRPYGRSRNWIFLLGIVELLFAIAGIVVFFVFYLLWGFSFTDIIKVVSYPNNPYAVKLIYAITIVLLMPILIKSSITLISFARAIDRCMAAPDDSNVALLLRAQNRAWLWLVLLALCTCAIGVLHVLSLLTK